MHSVRRRHVASHGLCGVHVHMRSGAHVLSRGNPWGRAGEGKGGTAEGHTKTWR